MNVFAVVGLGVCVLCADVILSKIESKTASFVSAAGAVIILTYIVSKAIPALEFIEDLISENGMEEYFSVIIKSLGVSLMCEAASGMCRDFGEGAVGNKIELAGRVYIILLSLPIIKSILAFAKELL